MTPLRHAEPSANDHQNCGQRMIESPAEAPPVTDDRVNTVADCHIDRMTISSI